LTDSSLQERYAPHSRCFGCGPSNAEGLRIRSHVVGDEVVAEWTPSPHHEAFEGVLAGGIVGTLLDCHSNWTAAHRLMTDRGLERPPTCVTAEYSIRLLRPTPTDRPVRIRARAIEVDGDRVVVDGSIVTDGRTSATSHGTFVAVRPGHPAYDRW
jgi:acyl-coenzyme A thioesterase PaaI-like protein